MFNGLSVAGGKPDFVLILVVFFAIFRGSVQGGLMGVALGLLEDLMTSSCLRSLPCTVVASLPIS